MAQNRKYDHEYKEQAVKLAKKIDPSKAAKELGIPVDTLYGRIRAIKAGRLDVGAVRIRPKMLLLLMMSLLNFVSK